MSFELDNGYIPASIETIISEIRLGINEEFETDYTPENFVGTNWYKFTYAISQRISEGEIKTSEVFQKLKEYIQLTNEMISRPVATNQGIVDRFKVSGYTASVKPAIEADAGKVFIAIDVDDTGPNYAAEKILLCTIIQNSVSLGMVTMGDQVESLVLTNGQSFDWKYYLPDRIETFLRLTVTTSENNQVVIGDPEDIKNKLLLNISERYQLGKNFEPQRYFTTVDAPWSSQVTLEYSFNDSDYFTAVIDADFDELYEVSLENITLIEN